MNHNGDIAKYLVAKVSHYKKLTLEILDFIIPQRGDGVAVPKETGDDKPLPAGWEVRKTAKGDTFYLDHIDRHIQWERPRMQVERVICILLPHSSFSLHIKE